MGLRVRVGSRGYAQDGSWSWWSVTYSSKMRDWGMSFVSLHFRLDSEHHTATHTQTMYPRSLFRSKWIVWVDKLKSKCLFSNQIHVMCVRVSFIVARDMIQNECCRHLRKWWHFGVSSGLSSLFLSLYLGSWTSHWSLVHLPICGRIITLHKPLWLKGIHLTWYNQWAPDPIKA